MAIPYSLISFHIKKALVAGLHTVDDLEVYD